MVIKDFGWLKFVKGQQNKDIIRDKKNIHMCVYR